MIAGFCIEISRKSTFQTMQNQSACIGPNRGPVQAKMAENACKGPENGPVRAPKEKIGLGTAPTLNRSTLSEAMAPSGEQAAGVYEGAEPPVLRYGVVNLYLTFLEDMERMYLIGIQATST